MYKKVWTIENLNTSNTCITDEVEPDLYKYTRNLDHLDACHHMEPWQQRFVDKKLNSLKKKVNNIIISLM